MSQLTPRLAAGLGLLTALVLGTAVQMMNISTIGSLEAILRVGTESEVRTTIEADLGPVPLTLGIGHDGQFFYASARDPFALQDARVAAYSTYRHRRVGYPLLAGLGGILSAEATLVGLTVVPILGLAVATAAAILLVPHNRREVALAAVLASPGLWLSLSLATADTLALGAGLGALAAFRRDRRWLGVGLLMLAAFTKETHLLFSAGAAAWYWAQRDVRWAARVALGPGLAYAAWMVWLQERIPSGGVGLWNFTWPTLGFAEALPGWSGGEALLAAVSVISVLVGGIAVVRSRSVLLRLTLIPWLVTALVASEVVWRDGNNIARVVAPLLTLGAVGLVMDPDSQLPSTSRKNLPV